MYLARLYNDFFLTLKSDDVLRDVVITCFMKIAIKFFIFSLSVKFNNPFCQMGLAIHVTMAGTILMISWFESRYISKV